MTRTIIIVGFLCAFAAGFALNLGWSQSPPRADDRRDQSERGSWLAEQLNLNQDQQEKMKEIWSDAARRGNRQQWEHRRRLREERDQAIAALIPESNRAAYEQVLADYEQQTDALEAQWRQSFEQAVERTKALLSDEQRQTYEQILERQRRGNRDDRRRGPETQPVSDASSEQ